MVTVGGPINAAPYNDIPHRHIDIPTLGATKMSTTEYQTFTVTAVVAPAAHFHVTDLERMTP